ncbi:uncharacterized protein si:dkeyp-38g8.5 isoform X2 [Limanda limanda]|uniref:uncharacterized protein si:dkeyp-38g8.5 isoform X2 n=1 Tax=Limanda limanda TaxID=27771 RepID=UPI0029C827E0|nr:uncharacterized protein si:dkeyp-38g8.5 isoform X2 [Limanda limanda]
MDNNTEERLVEEVRRYEHLYNPSASDYKDEQLTEDSWREISAVVGLDVSECIKTWRRMRDKFVRVKKATTRSGGDAGRQNVPDFFISMSWLMPHIKHRMTKSKRDKKAEPSSTSAPEFSTKSSTSAPEFSTKSSTSAPEASPECTLSPSEVEEFVKLRVCNTSLFSGNKYASRLAWKAIVKHMGLQNKMTFRQASEMWENMKKKYKALKSPPDGMKVFPETWAHFHLMDEAAEGQLEGSAPVLKVFPVDKGNRDFLPISKPKKRRVVSMGTSPPVSSVADRPEIEVSLNGDEEEEEEEEEESLDVNLIMQEVDAERNVMEAERQVMDKEIRLMERERLVLERERAVLDREAATLERERATLDREMAMMERERVVLEREKAMVEKDKDAVCMERRALERARLGRLVSPREATEEATENHGEVTDSHPVDMDRKERFLSLFEKLIESF